MATPRGIRFSVFGRPMLVTGSPGGWQLFHLGPDGKRRPADCPIPRGLDEEALAQYLEDVFHEAASPRAPDVLRLPDPGVARS